MCFVRFILAEKKKSCHYMPSSDRNNIQMGTPLTRNITLMRTLQLIVTLIWSPTNAKPVAPKSQKKYARRMQTMPSQAFLCG